MDMLLYGIAGDIWNIKSVKKGNFISLLLTAPFYNQNLLTSN